MKGEMRQPVHTMRRPDGFTLLELVVVITILGVLFSIALPSYRQSVLQAKEATLRENLYRFRDAIDQFQADKGRYPETLDMLVAEGYLRKIPVDPMGGGAWVEVPPEFDADSADPADSMGVFDVHSASPAIGSNGVPYGEW